VVHLGTDLPAAPAPPAARTLVSVGHLVERKRHADVVRALAALDQRFADVSYVVVGDGPQREPLRALASQLGVADRVQLRGQLAPAAALATARQGALFVLPSVDEAFGVAYVEAMAAGVPAIGCRGEAGPEEIAAAGGGMVLVEPRDPPALAQRIAALLDDAAGTRELGHQARENVRSNFTWERCGQATLAAYREALR
jgi:glycosyltransferase involved in cell wall biosynthesis